jgi:hypothetical protein
MPENNQPQDFSPNLRLDFPAPRARIDTLRSDLLRSAVSDQGATAKSRKQKSSSAAQHTLPAVVLTIGLYEFIRAVVLGLMYALAFRNPAALPTSHSFWTFFIVLSNGAARVTPFLPITILYALAIGTCLWFRVNWGRRVLIATSFWAVFRLGAFLVAYNAVLAKATDARIADLSWLKEAAFMLAGLNILIGLYLAFAPGVAEAFELQTQGLGKAFRA